MTKVSGNGGKNPGSSAACLEAVANRHANIAIRAYLRGQYDEYARRIKLADTLRGQAALVA